MRNVCAGLDDALVNELAYQLFLSTCGYDCSPDNLQSIRRHLQVLPCKQDGDAPSNCELAKRLHANREHALTESGRDGYLV
jgi:hypothetical protein